MKQLLAGACPLLALASADAATLTVTSTNDSGAGFAYTVNGVTQSKSITRQVFVPPGTVCL